MPAVLPLPASGPRTPGWPRPPHCAKALSATHPNAPCASRLWLAAPPCIPRVGIPLAWSVYIP
eukprot:6205013-Pleurochrysis_carterae.AAC.1